MITILGAGVAGLCVATVLAERGMPVELADSGLAHGCASWLAVGMIAPFVEGETAAPEVARLGGRCRRLVVSAGAGCHAARHAGGSAGARQGRA